MKKYYPFSSLIIRPTSTQELAEIQVIAANKKLIELVCGKKEDFVGDYSKELHIIVPINYQKEGCEVYGAKWFDKTKVKSKHIHMFQNNSEKYGFQLCVGVPQSFSLMNNVILENVKTADNMLIAYERIMAGMSKQFDMIAYSHGEKGKKEFEKNKSKYIPERQKDEETNFS